EQLSSGRWTHDYPIHYGEARELGLNVSLDMPQEIMDLMMLFPDTIRRQSGVKYFTEDAKLGEAKNPHRVTMTGYAPQEGARSFSFGPWNPKELRGPREERERPPWRDR
ncbi:MAG: hypothetical protein AAFW81_08765, partial [Pseudomonadota bacterium]